MKNEITFSLILPCFNEGAVFADNVRNIARVLGRFEISHEVIFVDDFSSDRTRNAIRKICKSHPNFRAIFHTVNQGRGSAVTDGILAAHGVVVGYIDIDCEVSPVYIPEIVDEIIHNKADLMIGKRIYRTTVSSLIREVLSIGYRFLVTSILDTRNIDTESGYKFFRKSKIVPILPLIRDNHWFWDTEIVVFALRAKLKVVEVPVLFIRRFDKKSSVRVVRDVIMYLRNLWRLRLRMDHMEK